MRRRIPLLLLATLVGLALPVFAPAPSASAWIGCSGSGGASFSPGLLFPVLLGVLANSGGKDHPFDILIGDTTVVHGFFMNLFSGVCAHVRVPTPQTFIAPTAAGVMTGWCGYSAGTGTWLGQPFSYIDVGGVHILTGHAVGVLHLVPAVGELNTRFCDHVETTVPGDLATAGAVNFSATGVVAALNCSNSLPPTQTLFRLVDQDALIAQTLGVHIHVGLHFWTTQQCAGPPVLP